MLKNKQKAIAHRMAIAGLIFIVILLLPFSDFEPIKGAYPLVLLGAFLSITSFIIALIFNKRAKKMNELLIRKKLIAEWKMDYSLIKEFVNEMWRGQKRKNKGLMSVVGIFFFLITVIFLIIMDEGRGIFLALMGIVFLFILLASSIFPWYYKQKNLRGDGLVLLGTKYAYINGYFHNWDFPLSGLTKVKHVKKPFNGIYLVYYYTDRTLTNIHELTIPVPSYVDIDDIIDQLKIAN